MGCAHLSGQDCTVSHVAAAADVRMRYSSSSSSNCLSDQAKAGDIVHPRSRSACRRCECRARKTGGRGGKCVICMRMGRNDNAPGGSGKGGAKEDIWFSDGRISLSSSDVWVNCPSPLLCPANPAISRFAPLHVVIRVNRSIWSLLLRHACQSVRRTVMYRTQGKCFLRPMCTQLGCLHACDFSSFVQECCAKLCKKKGR